jgi:hypothetical protein
LECHEVNKPESVVGDELVVTVLPSVEGEEYQPVRLPNGQIGRISQRGRKYLDEGESVEAWVFRDDDPVLVTTSGFGRFLIGPKMQPRYRSGLLAGIELLEGGASSDAEALSDLTGMYSRSWRKDQADWLTVWKLIGRPDPKEAQHIGDLFRRAAREIRAGQLPIEPLARLRAVNPVQSLKVALSELGGQVWTPLELHSRAERAPAPPRDDAQPTMIMSEYSKQKLDRANSEHALTLDVLSAWLNERGIGVKENRLIDAYAQLSSGPAIFEIKSISPVNERAQIRSAVGQLLEYRYLHDIARASLWVVFSSEPIGKQMVDFLRDDQAMHVVWKSGASLAGPDLELLR